MKVYAIDFGTTNSSVAYYNNGDVTVLPIGKAGNTYVPTVLYFPENSRGESMFGDDALDAFEEDRMRGRLMKSIKTCLPDPHFEGTTIKGLGYRKIEDIIAIILKHLKRKADACTGEEVNTVVLGRPALFSDDVNNDALAQSRLEEAAKKAGFEHVFFQREPIAAAYFYERLITKPELALIVDLGGGTSDFTLMRLRPTDSTSLDRTSDVLGVDGVYVAGEKFDRELSWNKVIDHFGAKATWRDHGAEKYPMPLYWMSVLCEWHRSISLKRKDVNAFIEKMLRCCEDKDAIRRLETVLKHNHTYGLSRAVEKTKIALSESEAAPVSFVRENIHVDARVTRAEFEQFIAGRLGEILAVMQRLLDKVNVGPQDIDAVFLTGGTARTPIIRDQVAKLIGKEKVRSADDFISVCHGLALSVPNVCAGV